jgi:hypothetical protein
MQHNADDVRAFALLSCAAATQLANDRLARHERADNLERACAGHRIAAWRRGEATGIAGAFRCHAAGRHSLACLI